jgi:prepilin-type N-terminal cleavage/methylation domain-containing protein
MKKDGFTLIETTISIFILTVLLSVGMSQSTFGNNLAYSMEKAACVYEIQNILSYGKAMCKEKNKYGKIVIDSSKNEIKFIEGWDDIEKVVKLPTEIIIVNKYKSIQITSEGKIAQGITIELIDKYRERQDITISVGVDLITIKDGKFL